MYFAEGWQEGDPSSLIQDTRAKIGDRIGILDELAPGSATYFNEVNSIGLFDFLSVHGYNRPLSTRRTYKTFFSSHYEKLKAIKNKYDKEGLFVMPSGKIVWTELCVPLSYIALYCTEKPLQKKLSPSGGYLHPRH